MSLRGAQFPDRQKTEVRLTTDPRKCRTFEQVGQRRRMRVGNVANQFQGPRRRSPRAGSRPGTRKSTNISVKPSNLYHFTDEIAHQTGCIQPEDCAVFFSHKTMTYLKPHGTDQYNARR
jgi:hypothetical protein